MNQEILTHVSAEYAIRMRQKKDWIPSSSIELNKSSMSSLKSFQIHMLFNHILLKWSLVKKSVQFFSIWLLKRKLVILPSKLEILAEKSIVISITKFHKNCYRNDIDFFFFSLFQFLSLIIIHEKRDRSLNVYMN